MARVDQNLLLNGISGSLGKIIFKNYKHGTVISKRPDMSKVKRTRVQKQNSERFMNAVEYARSVVAHPELKKPYEKEAKKTGRTIYHLALSDFMSDPTKTLKGIPPAPPAAKRKRKRK